MAELVDSELDSGLMGDLDVQVDHWLNGNWSRSQDGRRSENIG